MFQRFNMAMAFCLMFGFCVLGYGRISDAGDGPAQHVIGDVPKELNWKAISPSDRPAILELLKAKTQSNYERINTWTARYTVLRENYLSPQFVERAFADRLPENSTPDLIQASEIEFTVAIEMSTGSIFRDSETTSFRFLTTDSRDTIVIQDMGPIDNRSVVTSEHYVYFAPKHPPVTNVVAADHPQARNKRTARRVSLEDARGKHHAELMDPRQFFRCSTPSMAWEELEMYLSMISGEKGAEQQEIAKRLQIDQADFEGNTWYRIRTPITFPDGRISMITSIWSPLAGFNPVSLLFTKDNAEGEITKSIHWNWKDVDGIYVPAAVSEVWRPERPGHVNTFKRVVELTECSLNQPLAPDQFTYSALGLKQGELVMDEINQAMLKIDKDDQAQFLFSYSKPNAFFKFFSHMEKWMFLAAQAVLIVVIFAVFFYRRSKKLSQY